MGDIRTITITTTITEFRPRSIAPFPFDTILFHPPPVARATPDDRNVYGAELEPCCTDPMTGFLRDGYCRRVESDRGRHEICAVMTEEFLRFSLTRGNDLTAPKPEFEFPGLEPGDRWCLCLARC